MKIKKTFQVIDITAADRDFPSILTVEDTREDAESWIETKIEKTPVDFLGTVNYSIREVWGSVYK